MVRQCQLVNNKEEAADSHNHQGTWQRKQTIDLTADTLLQYSAMVSYIKVCVFALCPSLCRIRVSAISSCIRRCWAIKKNDSGTGMKKILLKQWQCCCCFPTEGKICTCAAWWKPCCNLCDCIMLFVLYRGGTMCATRRINLHK